MHRRRAPPHPRGSTPGAGRTAPCATGSPAPAGIDPDLRDCRASDCNGSPAPAGIDPSMPASPTALAPGSPAPAGIDPHRATLTRDARRLPRTRGDRPARTGPRRCRDVGLPRTRGDRPRLALRVGRLVGLPRTRGDRPADDLRGLRCRPRLPRTRGDRPETEQSPEEKRDGSPAPAGIDPLSGARIRPCSRLPRTRGDRPGLLVATAFPRLAPPHPRGSTLERAADTALHWAPPHPRGSTRRFQGGRGGGHGSPAPAGIDPVEQRAESSLCWLPRTRGDRPIRFGQGMVFTRAPPHPRGSTRVGKTASPQAGGSPAPAGIDHLAQKPTRLGIRLPRTRGDRPLKPGSLV